MTIVFVFAYKQKLQNASSIHNKLIGRFPSRAMTAVTKWPVFSLFTAAEIILLGLVDGEVVRFEEAFIGTRVLIRVEDQAVVLDVFAVTKWLQQN